MAEPTFLYHAALGTTTRPHRLTFQETSRARQPNSRIPRPTRLDQPRPPHRAAPALGSHFRRVRAGTGAGGSPQPGVGSHKRARVPGMAKILKSLQLNQWLRRNSSRAAAGKLARKDEIGANNRVFSMA